jgi:hypothetical protein
MVRESEADGVNGCGVERGLAGDATNAVGSEEFLHQMDLHVYYQVSLIRVIDISSRYVKVALQIHLP